VQPVYRGAAAVAQATSPSALRPRLDFDPLRPLAMSPQFDGTPQPVPMAARIGLFGVDSGVIYFVMGPPSPPRAVRGRPFFLKIEGFDRFRLRLLGVMCF
jgi:hypothetical protein